MSPAKPQKRRPAQLSLGARSGATLADVAAKVGVSANTISRSFRAPQTVRPLLRERINKIVDELNYVPNRLAGGLAGSHTGIVGVIVTSLFNSEFAMIIDTLQRDLATAGLQVMIGNSAYDPDEELRLVKAMLSWRPAAIAIVGTDHHPRVRDLLARAELPILHLWDSSDACFDSIVGMDHRQIGSQQAQHLVDKGCRRLAFVGSVRQHDYRAQKRLHGARQLASRALSIPLEIAIDREAGTPDLGDGLAATLLARRPDIDGIICNGDVIAMGVVRALKRLGRAVPRDVAVIGFGDQDAGTCLTPMLTTIRPPRAEIGHLAGQVILARVAGGKPQQHSLRADLVERESTNRQGRATKPGSKSKSKMTSLR